MLWKIDVAKNKKPSFKQPYTQNYKKGSLSTLVYNYDFAASDLLGWKVNGEPEKYLNLFFFVLLIRKWAEIFNNVVLLSFGEKQCPYLTHWFQ